MGAVKLRINKMTSNNLCYEWMVTFRDYRTGTPHTEHDLCAMPLIGNYVIGNSEARLYLVRNRISGNYDCFSAIVDGEIGLLQRSKAEVIDGQLPELFECGARVPRRFHIELQRAILHLREL